MKKYKFWIFTSVLLFLSLPVLAQSVTVIVNPKNTGELTADQISKIYLGKSNALVAADLSESNPLREYFYLKVTGKDVAQLKAYWAKLIFTGKAQPLREFSTDAEVKKFVAANPNGIGYIDKSAVDSSVKAVLVP